MPLVFSVSDRLGAAWRLQPRCGLTLYADLCALGHLVRCDDCRGDAVRFGEGGERQRRAHRAKGMLQTWLLKTVTDNFGIVVVLGGLTVAGGSGVFVERRT